MKGDRLSGPNGDARVVDVRSTQPDERDIVDFCTSLGPISVTADHRLLVCHHGQVCESAAGSLLKGGLLCTGPEQTIPFTAFKRKASTAVFYMSLAGDLPVYIDMVKFNKFVAKGCPGDPDYEYASPGSTPERGPPVVPRRPQSAPCRLHGFDGASQGALASRTSGTPTEPSVAGGQVHIMFKQRRIDDPPVLEVLRELADTVGCGDLLQDVNGGGSPCKHEVCLPIACARELQVRIEPAYQRWLQRRQQIYHGRSSKLVWKQPG